MDDSADMLKKLRFVKNKNSEFFLFIAKRYFSTKKKNNFVHIISLVSLVGVAIGTCALILVLSVFNGFEELILKMYNSFDPHLKITSAEGKF